MKNACSAKRKQGLEGHSKLLSGIVDIHSRDTVESTLFFWAMRYVWWKAMQACNEHYCEIFKVLQGKSLCDIDLYFKNFFQNALLRIIFHNMYFSYFSGIRRWPWPLFQNPFSEFRAKEYFKCTSAIFVFSGIRRRGRRSHVTPHDVAAARRRRFSWSCQRRSQCITGHRVSWTRRP